MPGQDKVLAARRNNPRTVFVGHQVTACCKVALNIKFIRMYRFNVGYLAMDWSWEWSLTISRLNYAECIFLLNKQTKLSTSSIECIIQVASLYIIIMIMPTQWVYIVAVIKVEGSKLEVLSTEIDKKAQYWINQYLQVYFSSWPGTSHTTESMRWLLLV